MIVGAMGYLFGPVLYDRLVIIGDVVTQPFSDVMIFYFVEVASYIVPLIVGIIFLVFNFIKKKYPSRVPCAMIAVEFFYTLYTIPIIYSFVLHMIDGGNILDHISTLVMIVIDIVFGILIGVIKKTKNNIIGVVHGLLFSAFFVYLMIEQNNYNIPIMYVYIGLGALLAIYSILCFIQQKKLDSVSETNSSEKEQEYVAELVEVEYEEDAFPKEHVKGYVEEPKEGEVLQDD